MKAPASIPSSRPAETPRKSSAQEGSAAGLDHSSAIVFSDSSDSFPRFAWECIPGRFASEFRQDMADYGTSLFSG